MILRGSNHALPKPRYIVRSNHPENKFCSPPLPSLDTRLIVESTLSRSFRSFLYFDDPASLLSPNCSEYNVGSSIRVLATSKGVARKAQKQAMKIVSTS